MDPYPCKTNSIKTISCTCGANMNQNGLDLLNLLNLYSSMINFVINDRN